MKKKLVVLFDGTWKSTNRRSTEFSKDGANVTNVVRFLEALKSGDNRKNIQLVHYVPGIGTRKFERFLGGVFGYGIGNYIKDAYSFIVSNYMPGDEIYLLGFSRGAYSARSLAGMIHNVGILQRRFLYLLNDAYLVPEGTLFLLKPDPRTARVLPPETWEPLLEPLGSFGEMRLLRLRSR